MKKAILIVNLGTPDSPGKGAVGRYLTQFLNDPYVIDIPQPLRFILVNLIIIPFRVRKSAGLYRRLWSDKGSPILMHLHALRDQLDLYLPDTKVYAAMRYGKPSIDEIIPRLRADGIQQLTVLPLYPQYAASTTETIFNVVRNQLSALKELQKVRYVKQFYDHPAFLTAFAQRIAAYKPETFDHVIFSFHSLPERHLNRQHPEHPCASCNCTREMPDYGRDCYKASSYETARRLASLLHLSPDRYSVAFQSRFAKKWIGPFTDDRIRELAGEGSKRILVAAPSFVADCLETIVEIGLDYQELFRNEGGGELVMAESLNAEAYWVKALAEIVEESNNRY